MTAATRCSASAAQRRGRSPMSPSTSGPQRTAARCPRDRLSKTTGRYPARASTLQACDPIYPAPPVTRIDCDMRAASYHADGRGVRCGARPRGRRGCRLNNPAPPQFVDDLRCGLFGGSADRCHPHLRSFGWLVGRIDTGEVLDSPELCLDVEALGITPDAFVERRVHKDF